MDFSGLEAQVFIGVAVILGCAFVALLCDYLKGVNERLRERSLELTVRLEESERWRQQTLVMAAPAPETPGAVVPLAVMDELTRLHREVERVSIGIASIAHLQSAVRESAPESPAATVPVAAATAPPYEPVFDPQRVAYREESFSPAVNSILEAERESGVERDSGVKRDSGAVEAVGMEAVTMAPAERGDRRELEPVPELQPALASAAPAPKAGAEDGTMVVIKPEITPALANILRTPPRQASAPTSLQELMASVAQPRVETVQPRVETVQPRVEAVQPRVETVHPRVETVETPAAIDLDVTEPVRPNAMKIRVVRNEAPPVLAPADPVEMARTEIARFESVSAAPPLVEVVPQRPMSIQVNAAPPAPAVPLVPAAQPEPASAPIDAFVAFPAASGELSLPSGMHDRATLDFLRADPTPFTGLVVAIGINDYAQLRESAGAAAADDLIRSIAQLVKSITSNLVGPQHFAARASDDEFVLVFNGEIGPAAQRRMAAVSERLWDFQLRSIGTFSVVFSWGAAEASEEPFAEAIENAAERMRETRQNRKAMGGDKSRKRVVA